MTGAPGGDPLARRPFGPTGLEVSPLCLGCAPLGDMPRTFAYSVPEERALATIRALLDSPINFLDTAASYGDGESERRIGLVLRERGGRPPGAASPSPTPPPTAAACSPRGRTLTRATPTRTPRPRSSSRRAAWPTSAPSTACPWPPPRSGSPCARSEEHTS